MDPTAQSAQDAWLLESRVMTAEELRTVKIRVAAGSIERAVADTVAREVEASLDAKAVAQLLQVPIDEFERRRLAGELWAFENEGVAQFPRWHLDSGRTIPGLCEVVASVAPSRHPFTVNGIMRSAQRDLMVDGAATAPGDWLLAGRALEPVLVLLDLDAKE